MEFATDSPAPLSPRTMSTSPRSMGSPEASLAVSKAGIRLAASESSESDREIVEVVRSGAE